MKLISILLPLWSIESSSWAHPLPETNHVSVYTLSLSTKLRESHLSAPSAIENVAINISNEVALRNTATKEDHDISHVAPGITSAKVSCQLEKSVSEFTSHALNPSIELRDDSAIARKLSSRSATSTIVKGAGDKAVGGAAEAGIGEDIKTWQKVLIGIASALFVALLAWLLKRLWRCCCGMRGKELEGGGSNEKLMAAVGTVAQ